MTGGTQDKELLDIEGLLFAAEAAVGADLASDEYATLADVIDRQLGEPERALQAFRLMAVGLKTEQGEACFGPNTAEAKIGKLRELLKSPDSVYIYHEDLREILGDSQ